MLCTVTHYNKISFSQVAEIGIAWTGLGCSWSLQPSWKLDAISEPRESRHSITLITFICKSQPWSLCLITPDPDSSGRSSVLFHLHSWPQPTYNRLISTEFGPPGWPLQHFVALKDRTPQVFIKLQKRTKQVLVRAAVSNFLRVKSSVLTQNANGSHFYFEYASLSPLFGVNGHKG